MVPELLDNRYRAIGLAAALAINALLFALLLTLSNGLARPGPGESGMATFDVSQPPPPPPTPRASAVAAPPSRGATRAPLPPEPPHPLSAPTAAAPAVDAGSGTASGVDKSPGAGAGRGSEGSGGGGAALVSPPVHVAGDLTAADYRRAGLPKGAGGQVIVGFRVRGDGRVDRCRVARSSGIPAIDAATCRLIEQRFRFRPARTASGKPVDAQIQWAATWQPR